MERPEKGSYEETPEMGYEIERRDRDITGGVTPGLQEIYDDPSVEKEKNKKPPITPEERQRIIDGIKEEERKDRAREKMIEKMIREKNKQKKPN